MKPLIKKVKTGSYNLELEYVHYIHLIDENDGIEFISNWHYDKEKTFEFARRIAEQLNVPVEIEE